MWDRLNEIYDCPVIQNNFELPLFRTLGNATHGIITDELILLAVLI